MGAESVLVSAIVVNHNGASYAEEAVESLLKQDLPDIEVIVVDNASSDGSDTRLDERFGSRITLIRLERNVGFGAGNNVGFRRARGRYLLLLNSDAVAAPSFAREMVRAAQEDTIGMVAAKVLQYDRRDILDTVGHLLYPDGLNRGRGRLEVDQGQYDECRTALFPSGAAALYRREMLESIGLFDEEFFLYGDDTDLGLRGRLAGWECALAPQAVAYHRYSRSTGPYSSLKAFYVERNRVWVLLKLFPLRLVAISPLYTVYRLALQALGTITGRGAASHLAAERSRLHLVGVVVRAYASSLRGLPRIVRERRSFGKLRRLGTSAFVRLLKEFRLTAREVALKD